MAKRGMSAFADRRFDDDGRIRSEEPDEQYLTALLEYAWQESDAQRALDEEMEALIDDEVDLGLPDGIGGGLESEEVRGGWGMELVHRIRQWWPRVPTIRVPAMGAGDDPENFSNDLEAALNALIAAQTRAYRGPGGPFFDSVKTDMIAYGRGFGAVFPSPRAYKDFPVPPTSAGLRDPEVARGYMKRVSDYTKGALPPLVLRRLSARRVYPLFDDDGLAEVFWVSLDRVWSVVERAKRRGSDVPAVLRWVSEADKRVAEREAALVPVVRYANREWMAEMVGTPRSFPPERSNVHWAGEDVELVGRAYRHWLDRVPVAYFPGMSTPLSAYHKQTVSAVYQARNVVAMLDRLMSMKATAVRTWAWPTPVLKTSLLRNDVIAALDDGRPRPIEIVPGLMLTLWPDEEVTFLSAELNGRDESELLALMRQQFDRIGVPPVDPGADVSGYAYAQMRQTARGKWGAIESGLIQGWDDLAWIELGYLAQMPTDVFVPTVAEIGWSGLGGTFADRRTRERTAFLKVSPKKVRERNFQLFTTVEPDKSLDLVANAQAASAMIQMGLPKMLVFERVLGLDNTTELRTMSLMERFRESDAYTQALFADALRAGRLSVEAEQQPAGGLSVEELSQYTPGQVQAMVQAGMIPPEVAQMYMEMQAGNVMPGQVGGAMAQGGVPPGVPPGGLGGVGGSPAATALSGAVAPVGAPPAAGLLGALGGAPSPLNAAPPAPLPMGAPIGGRGRAPGQSRLPPVR